MAEALELAARGRGRTSPNPMVGALLLSPSSTVVGRGFHARAGEAHAEARALGEAGARARGATLYCTLEPCSHTGRTGPCTAKILDAGVQRVVVGMVDPDPRVSGAGIEALRAGGVVVDEGVRQREAIRLNEAFVTRVTQGRPFVSMKIAISRDGRIAARPGARTPLTSENANELVHRWRAEVDAIGVGSGTLLADDPRLTARGVTRRHPLTRVVFDRRLRTPPDARLLETLESGPVIVMTGPGGEAKGQRGDVLRRRGARVVEAAGPTVGAALARLAEMGVTSLLLEGGAAIHRAAWREGVVDRVCRFESPVVLGDDGVRWIDEEVDLAALVDGRRRELGPDVLVEGYVHRVD